MAIEKRDTRLRNVRAYATNERGEKEGDTHTIGVLWRGSPMELCLLLRGGGQIARHTKVDNPHENRGEIPRERESASADEEKVRR